MKEVLEIQSVRRIGIKDGKSAKVQFFDGIVCKGLDLLGRSERILKDKIPLAGRQLLLRKSEKRDFELLGLLCCPVDIGTEKRTDNGNYSLSIEQFLNRFFCLPWTPFRITDRQGDQRGVRFFDRTLNSLKGSFSKRTMDPAQREDYPHRIFRSGRRGEGFREIFGLGHIVHASIFLLQFRKKSFRQDGISLALGQLGQLQFGI